MDVLFVCSGNTCRSPMAEAIMRDLAERRSLRIRVSSAGLQAGETMAEEAVEALRRNGVRIDPRPAVQLSEELVAEADLILCAAEQHRSTLAQALPSCGGRAYVWGDFAARADRAAQVDHLSDLLAELARTPPEPDQDLPDPLGRGQEAYDATAESITRLATATIAVLERLAG